MYISSISVIKSSTRSYASHGTFIEPLGPHAMPIVELPQEPFVLPHVVRRHDRSYLCDEGPHNRVVGAGTPVAGSGTLAGPRGRLPAGIEATLPSVPARGGAAERNRRNRGHQSGGCGFVQTGSGLVAAGRTCAAVKGSRSGTVGGIDSCERVADRVVAGRCGEQAE